MSSFTLAPPSLSNSESSAIPTVMEGGVTTNIDILAPSCLRKKDLDTRPSSNLLPLPSAHRALSNIPATTKDQGQLLVEQSVFLRF